MNPYLRSLLSPDFDPDTLVPVSEKWVAYTLGNLFQKLSYRMHVICALTAAEMVLPIWERNTSATSLPIEEKDAPLQAIKMVRRWLVHPTPLAGLKTVADLAMQAADNFSDNTKNATGLAAVVRGAVYATAISAGNAANTPSNVANTVNVVQDAGYATLITAGDDFYSEWWNRCKPLLRLEYQDWIDRLRGEK